MSLLLVGDARTMPLNSESIDLILTSPPYNVGLRYDGYSDNLPHDEFVKFNHDWLADAYRVMRETGRMYVVLGDNMLWWFRELAEIIGLTYVQKLVWCKPNFVGSAGRVTNDWNYMTEDILLFRKGKRTPMLNGNTTTHNWMVETVPQSNFTEGRIHPAQFPVSLCLRILDRTPGNIVLDPFVGSGSVLVAAKRLARVGIGIDIVPDVIQRAKKRLDATMSPLLVINHEQADMPLFAMEEQA